MSCTFMPTKLSALTGSGSQTGFTMDIGIWEAIRCGFINEQGQESRIFKVVDQEKHSITFRTKVFEPEHVTKITEEFLNLHFAYADAEVKEFEAFLSNRPGTILDTNTEEEYAAFRETEGFQKVAKAFRTAYRYAMKLPYEDLCDIYTLFTIPQEDAFEEIPKQKGDPEETFLSCWWDHLDDGLFAQKQEDIVEALYGQSHEMLKTLMEMGAERCGMNLTLDENQQ